MTFPADASPIANWIVLQAIAQHPATSFPDASLTVQSASPAHAAAHWAPALDAPTRERTTHSPSAQNRYRLADMILASFTLPRVFRNLRRIVPRVYERTWQELRISCLIDPYY